MNKEVNVADTSACVLEILIVNNAVPPALMVLEEKLLEIVGLDSPTVSVSAAVQVWLTHDSDEFVLVTLSGGEITAVFVTWLWASAIVVVKKSRKDKITKATMRWVRQTNRD